MDTIISYNEDIFTTINESLHDRRIIQTQEKIVMYLKSNLIKIIYPFNFIQTAKELLKSAPESTFMQGDTRIHRLSLTKLGSGRAYLVLLRFLIAELECLPFDNVLGETREMRDDAKMVVDRLVYYLRDKYYGALKSYNYDPHTLGVWSGIKSIKIEDIFDGHHEVFKNKITSYHRQTGLAYSLDLVSNRDKTLMGIKLDRFYVTYNDWTHDIKIEKAGSISLDLLNGGMSIDLHEVLILR